MAKQKAKTVDKSISQEELDQIVLPEEEEAKRLKDFKYQEKLAKKAKKEAREEAKEDIQDKIEAKVEENVAEGKKPKKAKSRSGRYSKAKSLVDRTKSYDLKKAVALLKKASYSKFPGTVVVDAVVKDSKVSVELSFPHSTGKAVRVAIADDDLLTKISAGHLDFDVLLATPAMMPKLAKHARVLGPKGLMPNPKNNTVTADPDKSKKELEGGKQTVKTEKKAPLLHVIIGKTDQDDKQLVENVEALLKAVGPKKFLKLTLSATMSPGIKVDVTPYQSA